MLTHLSLKSLVITNLASVYQKYTIATKAISIDVFCIVTSLKDLVQP